MCDPVSLAVGAIGGGAVLGFAGSHAQYEAGQAAADAQYNYQRALVRQRENLIKENYARTLEAYRFQLGAETTRIEEVRQAAAQQIFNVNQAALQARSAAAAVAASRGAAGQSAYLTLLDYITQAGVQVGGIQRQFQAEAAQSVRNQKALWMQARDRAASIQPYIPAPVQPPMDTRLMDAASGAFGAFTSFGLPLIQAQRATSTTPTSTTSTPALGIT